MTSVALVTGANQGLGLALVRGLARRLGPDGVVYLTARDATRGREAVRQLEAKGLHPRFHLLDVRDNASVRALADTVRTEAGGVDVVISNAAARISPDLPMADQVATFVDTNNHGTQRVINAFRPLLKNGARFIVVASSFGVLHHLPVELRHHFDESCLTPEGLLKLMDRYVGLVESGEAATAGWPEWINIPSKIAQIAAMRLFAQQMTDEARRRGILINAVCPGLVDTDASRPWFDDMSHALSPDEAAADVLWLATLPKDTTEPYGELVQYRKTIPYQ
jgi:NAD(P)-dependent dehydrogenase (short-subunit alcohol dehydrogenase family)